MRNSKYLQKMFFLLVMGFSLSSVCVACGDDDEDDEPFTEEQGGGSTDNSGNDDATIPNDSITNDSVSGGDEPNVSICEAVDLGLPSGLKWASCNVGASSIDEKGKHYAWGEVENKETYTEENYKYYDSFNLRYVYIGTDISGTEYDVAHMELGEEWRMPSKDDFAELLEFCTWEWIQLDGWKSGALFTGPNGNSIFLPGAGIDGPGNGAYGWGYYWTSTLENDKSLNDAYHLSITASEARITSYFGAGRYKGKSIRPVTGGKKEVETPSEEDIIKGEAIDLGLSVKWASHNVGASKPEEFGDYYSWGEIEDKDNYNQGTYKWTVSGYMTKYATHSYYGNVDKKLVLDEEDDVARVKWGENWRMPTSQEINELINKCTWTKTTQNEVEGYLISASNGNSIFLPMSGYYERDKHSKGYGLYWSSSLDNLDGTCAGAFALQLTISMKKQNSYPRFYGLTVRPVCN